MAEVTVYDAERMKAIEDASIVNGEIDGAGHLILVRFDGSEIDAGVAVQDLSALPGGGLFKIAAVDLASPAATIDIQNIPQTYESLRLVAHLRTNFNPGVTYEKTYLSFNNDTDSTHYAYRALENYAATDAAVGSGGSRNGILVAGLAAGADIFANPIIDIPFYRKAHAKSWHAQNGRFEYPLPSGNLADAIVRPVFGMWNGLAAINRITISTFNGGSSFVVGSSLSLYGIKSGTP